jgi:hypothetical protein
MTIPNNLTHAEVGAFLIAVGLSMIEDDVCAEAVIDPAMFGDPQYLNTLTAVMQENVHDMSEDRAVQIITNLTPEEAISFVNIDHPGLITLNDDQKAELRDDLAAEEEQTYRIQRFYKDPDKFSETIKEGLTLAEAKEHCSDPSSEGDGWFDGFEME